MALRPVQVRKVLIACCLGAAAAGAGAALYKWVDDQGRVQYSDTPPMKNKGGVQLSNRGIVVKKFEGSLTPEQQQAKEEAEARKKAEEARLTEQRRQDSALLLSFTTVDEIDRKRDREIQGLEQAIVNLRGRAKAVAASIAEDRKRLEAYDQSKTQALERLKGFIQRGEAEKKAIDDEIKRKTDQIAATRENFDVMKKRYLELKQSPSVIQPASAGSPSAKK
jgi:hypothetical protein